MSRWGRGRGSGVAVPLDHLFRENASNCPSAARSAGTVGKWGVTSFTSIRSHPYAFVGATATFQKKPRRDQNRPLTVPAPESDAPPPKPKKFFKSRNLVPSENAALPTSSVVPAEAPPSRSLPDDDPAQVPKLKIQPGKKAKFFATKAAKKEESFPAAAAASAPRSPAERTHLGPNKRYLVRNRDKVIDYSEERSNSPPPPPPPPPPRPEPPPPEPSSPAVEPPRLVKPGLLSPGSTNKDGKPPIVLRISKGTSRLLSTDSEDAPEPEAPVAEPEPGVASPPPLKITIKCYGKEKAPKAAKDKAKSTLDAVPDVLLKEPKEAGASSRAARASKRNQHKDVSIGEEPPPGGATPPPGSDNYELYKTLASPPDDSDAAEDSKLDDAETSPAALEDSKSEPIPEAKAPENAGGRARRHRQNINYNEDANKFIDELALSKTSKPLAKNYARKGKKKLDEVRDDERPVDAEIPPAAESPPPAASEANRDQPSDADDDPVKPKLSKKSHKFDASDDVADEKPPKTSEKASKHVFKSPKRVHGDGQGSSDAEDKPSVKLVITKKKGSIFKSRSLVDDGPGAAGKKRHLYKHKWADDGKGGQTPRPEPEAGPQATLQDFEEAPPLTRVTRYQKEKNPTVEDEIEPYTSVKCPKNAKDYYTVVRNVKKAHQIQEIGEFQEFNDDVEYILDALQDNNPMSTRCLSAITLASKCTAPAFRMHVRAHGTVAKFFRALHDATNDQSLGLCTATVMFVLSQDRLNMDLDRESLELMLNLLESEVSHKDALDDCGLTSVQLAKNKERVRELCAEIKSQGKAKHLDLDNITVGHLAMETLLSLTSKRAGEWFKEELRALGGVDHILSTICDCCLKIGDYVAEWSPDLLDSLRKIDRCMRVLENVTQQNEENQIYLVEWKNGQAVETLVKLFRLCDREIPLYPTSEPNTNVCSAGATVRDALLPTLKVLVNLTHPFRHSSMGSTIVGQQKGIIDASLHLLLQAPNYIPDDTNFDFSVCVLLLLMNLMQNNPANVKLLVEAQAPADFEAVFTCNKPAIQALVDHFYKQEELARLAERNTDAILDGEKTKDDETKEAKNKSHDEHIEETVAKLLQKAGTHMEHTMVGSYIVLLLGHVVMDSAENEAKVRSMLPNGTFEVMLTVLRKYFNFLNLTASAEAAIVAHVKATEKLIEYLDDCDKRHNREGEAGSSGAPSSSAEEGQQDYSGANATANTTSDSDKMSSSMELDSSFN